MKCTVRGDPAHVVIDGASAGAASVMFHLAAYGGRNDNLFVGVTESVWTLSQPAVSELEFQFDTFVNASGCVSASDTMSCLRDTSSVMLWEANVATPYTGRTGSPLFEYGPCIDGTFVRQTLYEAFRAGNVTNVPMIIG